MLRKIVTLAATGGVVISLNLASGAGAAVASRLSDRSAAVAKNVLVSSTSTVSVNKVSGIYSGKMSQTKVVAGSGGGSVPRELAVAAGIACDNLYNKGYEGIAAYVQLLWYRSSPTGPQPTLANFGINSRSSFHGEGSWSTSGIVSPSIARGEKFVISGGFWTSSGSELSEAATTTVYRGIPVKVACLPFTIVRHWPF
jgi:hypothetical protein